MAGENTSRRTGSARLDEVIPEFELVSTDVKILAEKYIQDERIYRIWFEYLIPDEIDLIFPTTDGKLNYLSFTKRLASAIRYGRIKTAVSNNSSSNSYGSTEHVCDHGTSLCGRSERFASVINRFLDLHQILKDC